jgi:hypothetical protein
MVVYSVGPDEFGEYYNNDGGEWIVEWYENHEYEGNGEAILFKDGKLYSLGLGHCSCNDPREDGFDYMCTPEEFLKGLSEVHGYVSYKEVQDKIVELLS